MWLLACLLGSWLSPAPAPAADPDSLISAIAAVGSQQRDVLSRRALLRGRISRAAVQVDSMKRSLPMATAGLKQTLSEAARWVALDDSLSRQLLHLRKRIASLQAEARACVAEEVARIAEATAGAPDPGLVSRLDWLRALRNSLDKDVNKSSQTPVSEPVNADADDGPEELRQKADLVWDLADQVGRQAESDRGRLEDLKLEDRLRRRLSRFAADVGFFDETVAAGRTVAPAGKRAPSDASSGEAAFGPSEGDRSPEPTDPLVAGTGPEVARNGGLRGVDAAGMDGIRGEMATLKARIGALDEQERGLRKQSEALRKALRRMLGEEP